MRCRVCGTIQWIPAAKAESAPKDEYAVALDDAETKDQGETSLFVPTLGKDRSAGSSAAPARAFHPGKKRRPRGQWRVWFDAVARDTSLLERESTCLILLSLADLFLTYILLRQGAHFYESNPVAQWFFQRWNMAGMTFFKFGLIGGVIAIGEVVERKRPGLGRAVLSFGCVAAAIVVCYSLKLLFQHGGADGF